MAETQENIDGGVVLGNPTPAQLSQIQSRMLQLSKISRIQALLERDPGAALKLAETLDDPAMRVIGLSYVVPGLSQSNSKKANSIYAQQQDALDRLKNGPDKIRALIAVAKAAYFAGDLKSFHKRIGWTNSGSVASPTNMSANENRKNDSLFVHFANPPLCVAEQSPLHRSLFVGDSVLIESISRISGKILNVSIAARYLILALNSARGGA